MLAFTFKQLAMHQIHPDSKSDPVKKPARLVTSVVLAVTRFSRHGIPHCDLASPATCGSCQRGVAGATPKNHTVRCCVPKGKIQASLVNWWGQSNEGVFHNLYGHSILNLQWRAPPPRFVILNREKAAVVLSRRSFSSNADGKKLGPLAGVRVLDMTRVLAGQEKSDSASVHLCTWSHWLTLSHINSHWLLKHFNIKLWNNFDKQFFVLEGPCCTQILGDLGAEIVKLERPKVGDDTRGFAPPFLPDAEEALLNRGTWRKFENPMRSLVFWESDALATSGCRSSTFLKTRNEVRCHAGHARHAQGPMSAYFAAQNRNKSSVTLNYTKPEGQEPVMNLLVLDRASTTFRFLPCHRVNPMPWGLNHLEPGEAFSVLFLLWYEEIVKRLLKSSDVLVENFKTGTLEKYGLSRLAGVFRAKWNKKWAKLQHNKVKNTILPYFPEFRFLFLEVTSTWRTSFPLSCIVPSLALGKRDLIVHVQDMMRWCRCADLCRSTERFMSFLWFWLFGSLDLWVSLGPWISGSLPVPSLLPCQAMGGYMSVTGEPEGEPMKVGVPVHDLYAGLHGVP